MSEYFKTKNLELGNAEQFGVELEFDVDLPEPNVDRKFCFLPKLLEKQYDAKFTLLNM